MVVAILGGGLSKTQKRKKRAYAVDPAVVNRDHGEKYTVANAFLARFQTETASLDLKADGDIEHLAQVVPLFLNIAGEHDLLSLNRTDESTTMMDISGSVVSLKPDVRERFLRVYHQFNRDGSGGLDALDLQRAMDHVGRHVSLRGAEYMLAEADTDNNGEIDFEEFYAVCEAVMKERVQVEQDALEEARMSPVGRLRTLTRESTRFAVTKIEQLPGGDSFSQAGSSFCTRVSDSYMKAANHCADLVENPKFELMVILCILLVGLATFVQVEHDCTSDQLPPDGVQFFLDFVKWLSLCVFTAELLVKIVACGHRPDRFFTDPEDGNFNLFDFIIVALSFALMNERGSIIAVCRLLRLLKILVKFEEVRVILLGLFAGMRAVNPIMLMMLVVIFFWAILGKLVLAENDPGHFENIGTSMLTLFQVATLASWGDVFRINYFGCSKFHAGLYVSPEVLGYTHVTTSLGRFHLFVCDEDSSTAFPIFSSIYFFLFTVLTAFVILSLFISVITTAMFEIMRISEIEKNMKKEFDQMSPTQKKERILAELNDADSNLQKRVAEFFCAVEEVHYNRLVRSCKALHSSPIWDGMVLLAIFGVGIIQVLEADTYPHKDDESPAYSDARDTLGIISNCILAIFTLELAVGIVASFPRPLKFFREPWHVFDFLVVALSYIGMILHEYVDSSTISGLRLLRIVKLFNSFPGLRSVAVSLVMSFKDVTYVLILIFIIDFIFATLGIILFSENDPDHFGSVGKALMSIWQIETLDGWEDIMLTNMYGCWEYGYFSREGHSASALRCDETTSHALGWYAAAFFIIIVILGGLVLPTVLIGVISIAFDAASLTIKQNAMTEHQTSQIYKVAHSWGEGYVSKEQMSKMREIFAALNFDKIEDDADSFTLESGELVPFLDFVCAKYLEPLDEDYLKDMFQVMDVNRDGLVSLPEFMWFMLYLKKQFLNGELAELKSMDRGVNLQKPQAPVDSDSSAFEAQPTHEQQNLREAWLQGLKVLGLAHVAGDDAETIMAQMHGVEQLLAQVADARSALASHRGASSIDEHKVADADNRGRKVLVEIDNTELDSQCNSCGTGM